MTEDGEEENNEMEEESVYGGGGGDDNIFGGYDAGAGVGTNSSDEADTASIVESGSDFSEEGSDKDNKTPPADPNEALIQAINHKEEGNSYFKAGDLISAARSYRHGTTLLKNLNQNNTGDDQVKQLIVSLQTNLSMVCFKQNKHKMSRDVANKALEVDNKNVKALYRRGVASRALGDIDAARADLKEALKCDPANTAVKKELLVIKKSLEDHKKKEKARLQKAFSKSGGSLLYSDKEAEEQRKLEEKKEKERQEAEALKKRKQEWEDECVRRMSSEPPEEAISYEDWDKSKKKKEEDEEKARKKAKKEEEHRKREEKRKAREAQKARNENNDDDSSDDELTEKEMAMLRGYKKTSDGRTTSYFTREQTEEEKELIGCIKPKRLEEVSDLTPSPTAASQTPLGSVWNQSGTTWEEKDTTDWCHACLTECLKEATAVHVSNKADCSLTYVAVVKEVKSLTGDASVALAGGKKRYIYDFHATIEYDILDDGDDQIASAMLNVPDINSATTAEEELEVDILGWKKEPDGEGVNLEGVNSCRDMLVQDVRKSVLRFVEKFNTSF